MTHLRFLFHTLATVPPLPAPRSLCTSRSSSLTSSCPLLSSLLFLPFVRLGTLLDELSLAWGGYDGDVGESTTDALLDDERDESCSLAISSRNRSCSVMPRLPPFSPGTPGAVRDGCRILFEMSSPMGFLRLMADLAPPKGDGPGDAVGVDAPDVGDKDAMDIGGAAKRELLMGGAPSDIVLDVCRCVWTGDEQELYEQDSDDDKGSFDVRELQCLVFKVSEQQPQID